MKRRMKGGLAILSAAVMTFSILSSVMVNELPVKAAAAVSNPRIVEDGTVTWDKITFGSYPQDVDEFVVSPIKWRILDIDSLGNAFLFADEAIDCKPYNENGVEKIDEFGNKDTDYSCTWETSTLRDWLNGTDDYLNDDTAFINVAFSDEERAEIIETTIVNEDNSIYDVEGGNSTDDKVYLLSMGEASTGQYGFGTAFGDESKTRIAKTTNYARMNGVDVRNKSGVSGSCYWWLRTPGDSTGHVASVDYYGKGDDDGNIACANYYGVRPVLHVNLSAVTYAGTVTSSGKTTEGTNGKKTSSEYKKPVIDSSGVTTWDCVYFGNYKQKAKLQRKPIEWRVLSVNGNDAFVMADGEIDCKPYNENGVEKVDDDGNAYIDYSCTWETCTLRDWLNGTDSYSNDSNAFINSAFSDKEREAIIQTEVINDDNNSLDKVYILSMWEASNVSYGFEASFEDESKAREAKVTDYAYINGSYYSGVEQYKGNCFWWLRTPGEYNRNALSVDLAGCGCGSEVDEDRNAIRPVLHVNLSSQYVKASGTVSLESSITKEDIEIQNKANEVINLISAIGEVTKDKKTEIDAARKAYDTLTDIVKAKVLNYTVLKMAESKYVELIKNASGNAGTTTQATQQVTPDTTQVAQQVTSANDVGNTPENNPVVSPKKVKVSSYFNKSHKKLVVKWKTVKGADGYEISIALKKNFKKEKQTKKTKGTSYTFTKLKKNKSYFIRVRAFVDNNGKKVYGKWSAVKKVKIKK